ncbi:MAG TPA: hypothetical protein VJN43_07475 [Bryobacteraceae bacterium]|nr:hypothetical protein [Bryobacteraceae bacterium]
MADDPFRPIERALDSGGPAAGFDALIEHFRHEKKFPLLFEARLMKSRHALGLPVVQTDSLEDLPPDLRRAHERAFIDAAREVGALFLAEGDIPRAWPYFRAIGEPDPVAAAIEKLAPGEGQEAVIEIALQERVHPRKGFELILANYGTCRAITFFEQYPDRKTREDCIRLLVRTLHRDVADNIRRVIEKNEGRAPETSNLPELIAGRDWLFGEYDYYVDTSHLVSILRFSLDAVERDTLAKALELSEYGKHLSSMFQFRGDPPFQDGFTDYSIYLRALLGECADEAIAHFRQKAVNANPDQEGTVAAQTLVQLLVRLARHAGAIAVSLEFLRDTEAAQLFCPTVFQLCQMAGDYAQLSTLARERGDLLHFVAAAAQS